MIVNDDTINRGYMLVEKYMVVPKHGIIIPGVQGMHPHTLCKPGVFCAFLSNSLLSSVCLKGKPKRHVGLGYN